MLSTKKILRKTIEVGIPTLLSRCFGIIREVLMVRYLGASGLSDVFLTAYKIPSSLRKIFAEGALSAAFIPSIVTTIKKTDRSAINGIMSLGFIIFEGVVLLLCALTMFYAEQVVHTIAPGFSAQQIALAVPMVHILMPVIFFISSSALLTGALQAVDHFFVPACAPILMNSIFIFGIIVCLFFNLSVIILCWFVLLASFIYFIVHVIQYRRLQFSLGYPHKNDFTIFGNIIGKFILCLPSVSLMELALLIDTRFASYLAPGSISLFFYANRFIGIPLGVFAVAFSTILLPHFSRVHAYAPRRLHFYLLEAAKFIFWITIPVALLMGFFAHDIFVTIFLSKKFTLAQTYEAGSILTVFTLGLFSFSLNKILLNIFYSMHATWISALTAFITTAVNIAFNIMLVGHFQTVGLAYAMVIAHSTQTVLLLIILKKYYHFRIYWYPFMKFVQQFFLQLLLLSTLFLCAYYSIRHYITLYASAWWLSFLLTQIGLWFWIAPLAGLFFIMLWYSRKFFNVRLYFLE